MVKILTFVRLGLPEIQRLAKAFALLMVTTISMQDQALVALECGMGHLLKEKNSI